MLFYYLWGEALHKANFFSHANSNERSFATLYSGQ